MALVLAQTLRHGAREGCKVALVPLVTDAPIILVAVLLATKLAAFQSWLGVLSVAGGGFVLYLAVDAFRAQPPEFKTVDELPRSWLKGILVNLLSPHPWLFWLTVGAAILAKATAESGWAAAAFLAGFYLLLVGSKLLLVWTTVHARALLAGRSYRLVLRILALLLAVFAVLLWIDGCKLLFGLSFS
jgi:threonine/homoserine/homoserine lactone efflux protein